MKSSIRAYLSIHLLLSVTLVISLAIIGNLFLSHKAIQVRLDAQLIHTTLRIRSFLSDFKKDKRDTATIQKSVLTPLSQSLREFPTLSQVKTEYQKRELEAIREAQHNLQFQIWDSEGKLIIHSQKASQRPLSNRKNGLSNVWLDHNSWRVNTLTDRTTGLTYMVAELNDYRQNLENHLTKDSILIMVTTYPFLALLIWVIVGRGLDILRRVAHEVRHRAPTYLKPVDISTVPREIEPLVTELNNLFSRLHEAFDREKRFTADAAHELRTPLAALNTHTQIALRAKTPKEREDALFKVLASVNRGTHVVQQLLTLNRMTPEAMQENAIELNLCKEAADIAAHLAPEAIAKKIELELICCNEDATIKGHPTAIGILLRNLIDNAIRYSQETSSVSIMIEHHTDKICLRVIDNGPGIPDELKDRVFERFYRVIGTKATGSGLGLGIVMQIAQIHHAEIKLETPKNGKGLDFQVWFPVKIDQR